MKNAKLIDMYKGWFVGNFEPSVVKTQQVEVAVKYYYKGDKELRHYHKVATEVTVIVSGKVRMNGLEYIQGDIVIVEPFEATDFEVLEDAITAVVKYPGAINDKYEGTPND